ncbi:MAG TPA: YidB family protein [Vicinamibacterales bacterium]|jgi:uncharacterized protein YidB (DUF937 family)
MGFLDALLKQGPAIAQMAAANPQVVKAALSLLSSRDTSVGGSGGLAGLVGAFQQKGLGDMVSSWISTGPNPPVTGSQLEHVMGADALGQFAQAAGVSPASAGGALASVLPGLIDHLTPQGTMPQGNALEDAIGSLLGSLGR